MHLTSLNPMTVETPMRRVPLGTLLVVAVLVGCEDASLGTTDPPPEGPPTLSGDVQPILTNNCAFNGCHGGNQLEPPAKPMSLDPGETRANTVNVASAQLPSMDRIEPGDPDASYLVHKIQGTQAQVGGSGSRMPEALPPLSQGQIDIIREWIADGARSN